MPTSGNIRFATDILRRLGEELNPNVDQGILELVKNAYDADATTCTVRLVDTRQGHGFVEVIDDGDGMNAIDITEGWLILGSSRKDVGHRTRLGRTPAGNKGLGRLAALRLGHKAIVDTVSRHGDKLYSLTLDWDQFDSAALVEDVDVAITTRATNRGHGTQIRIENLRQALGRMDVKRLARAMILLADPFRDDPEGFRPILLAPEFQDLERLVADSYFRDADYHLVAGLQDGLATAEVLDWRGESLYRAEHTELARSRDTRRYNTADARFELWAFTLNKQSFATRTTSVQEVRDWIDAFGGVHLYLNDLRVAPYGNPGNDWLDMNLRRVRSPEERPGTNTSIGRVTVRDTDGRLQQKTDRSGIIDSEAFDDLQEFATDALNWMARRRLATAEARRRRERSSTETSADSSKATVQEQIEQLPEELRPGVLSAFGRYTADRDREANALRREIQLYRTLSTAGITAATFAHESNGNPLKIIAQALNSIEFRGKKALGDNFAGSLSKPIASIRGATSTLGVLSSATLQLVEHDKRRIGRVELHKVVPRVLKTFEPFLVGRDVSLTQEIAEGQPYVYGTEAAVESILTNLINNSLAAYETSAKSHRELLVRTDVQSDVWELLVADNGPGIVDISLSDIWLPGETRRPDGTGLGLTIVRDAVADLGGSVEAEASGELGGATFRIHLPILGID